MTDLDTLIADLEAAEVGSAELDGRIWCALNDKRFLEGFDHSYLKTPQCLYANRHGPGSRSEFATRVGAVQKWSRSLDAAMTLLPKGEPVDHLTEISLKWNGNRAEASIINGCYEFGEARTPPLALCSAALRAKKTETE